MAVCFGWVLELCSACCPPTAPMITGDAGGRVRAEPMQGWQRCAAVALRTAQKVQNLSGLSLGSIQMAILGQLDLIRSSIMSKPFWPHPGSWQSLLPYLMLSAARWQICMSLVCHGFLLFHFQCLFSQLNEEEGRLLPTPRQEGYLRLFHWWAAHYQCLLDFLHGGLRVT